MTTPKPSVNTDPSGPHSKRFIAIVLACTALLGVLMLVGIEVISHLPQREATMAEVVEAPSTFAPPAPMDGPVVEVEPQPLKVAQPERQPAPVEVKPEPAPEPEPVVAAPKPEPAPEPLQVAEAPVEIADPPAPAEPAAPAEAAPKPKVAPVVEEPVAVDLAVTKTKGEPPVRSTGDVVWSAGEYPSLSTQYTGTVTFASGETASIVFSRSFVATPPLAVDVIAKDGPLQSVAAVAVLRADGKDIAIEVGLERTTLAESGAADGSFETLADATRIFLALLFENGDTATLKLTKPSRDGLETVLLPDRKSGQ